MIALKAFLAKERAGATPIYPVAQDVFNAFCLTPIEHVKVVIVGQDPYHGPGQAHGLCFSVQKGVAIPPSLKNIYTELEQDVGISRPTHGCLTHWATQGVLLLNATLTVRQGAPLSHQGQGWEEFTDAVIKILAQRDDPLVFLLWGRSAKLKCAHLFSLQNSPHLILTAAHPSPFSVRDFYGCKHFSQANAFLMAQGKAPIDWNP